MKTFSRFASLILFAAVLLHAHPNGTSKIAIRLVDPDSITVTVDANHDDLSNVLRFNVSFGVDTVFPKEVLIYQERLPVYLLSHLNLQADGLPLNNLKIIRWKPNGRGPEDDFTNDKAGFWMSNHVVTLGGVLPKPRKMLGVNVQLFAELGIQPISEISLYWRDSLLVRKWLGLDKTLRFNVAEDSLAAMLQRTREPADEKAARQENLVLRFISLGYTHILPAGMDHILFVLGLFFFSTFMRPLLWQITAFTIAHSITLGLAMAGVFTLPSKTVQLLIALSILVVGVENIFFRKVKASRWLIVFCFGLVHGMGFASALRGLGLPEGKFWSVLASFNVGVELGQLTVVTAAFLLTRWMWRKPWYFKRVVVPVSTLISLVALYWLVQQATGF